MKKVFYLALVAVVAVIATSCKPKGDAPVAKFDYSIENINVVTFTNNSTGATAYEWNFGDGETSTEAAPTHIYLEDGEFTVTLTAKNEFGDNQASEVISIVTPIIVVDGDFQDWADAIPTGDVAVVNTTENNKYENLYTMKFITDADYIYFYLEFNADTYITGEGAEGYVVDPIDFYLDVDGNPTTGSNSYLWENSAADYLIEGFWSNNYSDAGVYFFPAEADQTAWAWEDAGVVGSTTTCDRVILENGHAAIEGSIMRAMLPSEIVELNVGVFCSNTDWAESGSLPETTLNEDGTTTVHPLLNVKLN